MLFALAFLLAGVAATAGHVHNLRNLTIEPGYIQQPDDPIKPCKQDRDCSTIPSEVLCTTADGTKNLFLLEGESQCIKNLFQLN